MEEILPVLNRLQEVFAGTLANTGFGFFFDRSTGISINPDDGDQSEVLIKRVD